MALRQLGRVHLQEPGSVKTAHDEPAVHPRTSEKQEEVPVA